MTVQNENAQHIHKPRQGARTLHGDIGRRSTVPSQTKNLNSSSKKRPLNTCKSKRPLTQLLIVVPDWDTQLRESTCHLMKKQVQRQGLKMVQRRTAEATTTAQVFREHPNLVLPVLWHAIISVTISLLKHCRAMFGTANARAGGGVFDRSRNGGYANGATVIFQGSYASLSLLIYRRKYR